MASNFIGRADELDILQDLYENGAEIIRISGRRGIGKTAFVSEFCRGREHIMFSYRPTGHVRNMRALSELVGSDTIPDSVQDAVSYLSGTKDGRILFVIDNADRIPDIDSLEPMGDMTIVLVGTGLDDADIELEPFDLRESGYFFPDCMPREKLLIHAVTGGIPSYMTGFDRNISVADNIENLFFRENGRLFGEPESLLRSMGIREPEGYLSVLSAMSEGEDTINGIMRGSDDNSTASVLKHIEPLLGTVVERHVPEGMTRASYRLSDNMMRFWLGFVQDRFDEIASGRNHIFADLVEDEMDGYLSTVYRETCSRYMDDGYGYDIEGWTEPDENRTYYTHCVDDEEAYFISCTWSRRPAGKETLDSLRKYAGRKAPGRERMFIMFSAGGFRKDLELMAEEQDVDLVPLEGMFW